MQGIKLPFCDGDECYSDPIVEKLKKNIENVSAVIISAPVYNYDLNAVAKNLIELTGSSWNNKVVGFILAAGGKGSYMAPMSFINSLILDYRCIILPKFVYADKTCFDLNGNMNSKIQSRIEELVSDSMRLSKVIYEK